MLSRRAYLEETQREQRDEFLTNLKPGEVRQGVVSSVVNFGAFVDLGGMDGLVHVSELSWKHVDHPSSVVQVGDEVTVQVLDVDLSRERISLSLKATQQDPWQEFANGHQVGELVYGRVTKLVPFGAFVQVGEGIEGLVHISEMAAHHVEAPEQVVTPGEELWVKIIDIDLERRRISLSIKQAAEGGEVAAEYREFYGEHAYDEQGNYIGPDYVASGERRRRGRRRCRRCWRRASSQRRSRKVVDAGRRRAGRGDRSRRNGRTRPRRRGRPPRLPPRNTAGSIELRRRPLRGAGVIAPAPIRHPHLERPYRHERCRALRRRHRAAPRLERSVAPVVARFRPHKRRAGRTLRDRVTRARPVARRSTAAGGDGRGSASASAIWQATPSP